MLPEQPVRPCWFAQEPDVPAPLRAVLLLLNCESFFNSCSSVKMYMEMYSWIYQPRNIPMTYVFCFLYYGEIDFGNLPPAIQEPDDPAAAFVLAKSKVFPRRSRSSRRYEDEFMARLILL
jgi:hypothetical protein